MVEKSFSGLRQLNTVSATMHQRNADFLFEIPDLPTERWLGSVQLLLGGNGQTAGIGHGDEVTEMPEFHFHPPCLVSMGPAYKVFFKPASGLYNKKQCMRGSLPDRQGLIAALIRPARHGDWLVMHWACRSRQYSGT